MLQKSITTVFDQFLMIMVKLLALRSFEITREEKSRSAGVHKSQTKNK